MSANPVQHPESSYTASFGETYRIPMEACYVGGDAVAQLAAFAQAHCGRSCVVISDENTKGVGGEPVLRALSGCGKVITEKVFGADPIDATDTLGDAVAAIDPQTDFFVAVGSGSLCDLAKHAGTKLNRPVLLFPTAASMNGYTSSITAVKVKGVKRTIPCNPANGVFADPAVVATAPARMTAAGVADFLSKASASTDWRTAHFLRGESFSERAREFVGGAQAAMLAVTDKVGQSDPDAVAIVLEALLLSGFSMVVAGSSSPASGGEHLISHFIDMKHSIYGTSHDLHGTQVGVGTLHCLRLWEQILALDPATIDPAALADAQPTESEIASWIEQDWGAIAGEVQSQWSQKARDKAFICAELAKLRDGLPALRTMVQADLLPSKTVEKAIIEAGGPTTPEGLTVPLDVYRDALKRARFIRNRFTVLDLAAELGLA